MTSPFDQIAASYGEIWSETPEGRSQRGQVWRAFDRLFRAGDRVLDLGCGTGDDAVHMAARGIKVRGIDASEEMLAIARSRGVDATPLLIENLAQMEGSFTGAVSNFGVLNCVRDLDALAVELARLIEPEGKLAVCVMPRVSWSEFRRFTRRGDFRGAIRRWRGHVQWRGMHVYYRSSNEIRRTFSRDFRFLRTVGIGGDDHELHVFERCMIGE